MFSKPKMQFQRNLPPPLFPFWEKEDEGKDELNKQQHNHISFIIWNNFIYIDQLCGLHCFDVDHIYSCHVLLSVKRLSSETNLHPHWFMRVNIQEILGLSVGNVGRVHWAVLFVQCQVEMYGSVQCHTLLNSMLGAFGPTGSASSSFFPGALRFVSQERNGLKHLYFASLSQVSLELLPSAIGFSHQPLSASYHRKHALHRKNLWQPVALATFDAGDHMSPPFQDLASFLALCPG